MTTTLSFLFNDPRQLPMLPALSQIFDGCRLTVSGAEVSGTFGFFNFNNRSGDASDVVVRARAMRDAGDALLAQLHANQAAGIPQSVELTVAIERLRATLEAQTSKDKSDFAHIFPWSSIDARIMALAAVGIHKPWLSLVGVPPHGTVDDTNLYGGDAVRHTVDARENALSISDATPYGLAADQPWFKKPTRIRAKFCYEFARRAAERYVTWPIGRKEQPVIGGVLGWNEPDDGQSYPRMALGDFENAWNEYREDICLPMRLGVLSQLATRSSPNACPFGGPEAAYVSGLETQLAWEARRGTLMYDVIALHNWAQDGGKDTGTLSNWIDLLDEKMAVVERFRDGRHVMLTEMGDRGAGWILDALAYAIERYDFDTIVAYPSIDDGEQIIDPKTYELTSYGEKWKAFAHQMRRRPSQNGARL